MATDICSRIPLSQMLPKLQEQLEKATSLAAASLEASKRLQRDLDDSRSAASALRQDVREQFEFEAAKRVVAILARIEEKNGSNALADSSIAELLGQLGINQIGNPGDIETFDHSRHKDLEKDCRDGDPVIVMRFGYLWIRNDKVVIISKAMVSLHKT